MRHPFWWALICRFRVGIHTDRVFVGNFGYEGRISYTCVGIAVNIASQLEAENKVLFLFYVPFLLEIPQRILLVRSKCSELDWREAR